MAGIPVTPQRRLYKFGISLLAVSFALIIVELIARVFISPPQYAKIVGNFNSAERISTENNQEAVLGFKTSVLENETFYLHTPTGRRMRANTRVIIENHQLTGKRTELATNSLGYRNPEIGEKKIKRVLFLGDSITVQDYLDEKDTLVKIIEDLSKRNNLPIETINAGVSAIGLAEEFAILMETGLSTKPDVVVLNWFLNDIEPSPGILVTRTPTIIKFSRAADIIVRRLLDKEIVMENYGSVDPRLSDDWKQEIEKRFPPKKGDIMESINTFNYKILEDYHAYGTVWSDRAWEHMFPLFSELKRQANLHNFKLLIVAFPIESQVKVPYSQNYPQQKLKEVASRLNVPLLDLLPVLRKAQQEINEPLFLDFAHPTYHGNKIIAPEILKFINDNS